MRRSSASSVLLATLALTGCREARPEPPPAVLPPAPATWPLRASQPVSSCWARKTSTPTLSAPTTALVRRTESPARVLARLRARFGDRRFIQAAELGPTAPITLQHTGFFGKSRPPRDGVWLYLFVPSASPIGAWESELLAGGLRDELCLRRSKPFVGWSDRVTRGISDSTYPFAQRFPNPTPAAYRRRVREIAHAYGFRVRSLRLLRPLQLAPLLVVEADDRRAFARDAGAILARLDPRNGQATTFEGFFLEARDDRGPFMRVYAARRGTLMGSQWAWDADALPFEHGGSAPPSR